MTNLSIVQLVRHTVVVGTPCYTYRFLLGYCQSLIDKHPNVQLFFIRGAPSAEMVTYLKMHIELCIPIHFLFIKCYSDEQCWIPLGHNVSIFSVQNSIAGDAGADCFFFCLPENQLMIHRDASSYIVTTPFQPPSTKNSWYLWNHDTVPTEPMLLTGDIRATGYARLTVTRVVDGEEAECLSVDNELQLSAGCLWRGFVPVGTWGHVEYRLNIESEDTVKLCATLPTHMKDSYIATYLQTTACKTCSALEMRTVVLNTLY